MLHGYRVQHADPLEPRLNPTFLEYAQARGFVIDPTRVRRARDKGRVERAVPSVREDCFAAEVLADLEQARTHAWTWCLEEYGRRRHSRTLRAPREYFETIEQPVLVPAPTAPYDVPLWCDPKVARDQHAQVARALYSLPTQYVGRTLRARADRTTVRFYDGAVCIKVHPRLPPGGRAFDRADFPVEKTVYALRDVDSLARWAERHGPAVGQFARALLAGDLPWTRMRQVYALLGLIRRYGDARVNAASAASRKATGTHGGRSSPFEKRAHGGIPRHGSTGHSCSARRVGPVRCAPTPPHREKACTRPPASRTTVPRPARRLESDLNPVT